MTRPHHWLLAFAALLFGLLPPKANAAAAAESIYVLTISVHDTLQPVRARNFAHEMALANQSNAAAIVVNLSTPGGMPSAADTMVAAIRRSRIPVIIWTGLENSRIGGQGLRLLAEADVAFMNQDTSLSPLWADPPRGLMPEQRAAGSHLLLGQLADAVKRHGRNPSALDELTSGVHWFSAQEATQAGMVDGVARRMEEVLRLADGRVITRGGTPHTLSLSGAQIRPLATEGENLILLSLMNPNLDVLLLMLGLLLIYLEINTPGIVIPGAAGLFVVLLSAFALGSLPVSKTGLALCALALLLLVMEARFRTRGILASVGVIALIGGLGTLVSGPIAQLQVSWATAFGAGIGFGGITATLLVLGIEAKRAKRKTGAEAMLGWLAVAQTPLSPAGKILVRGELWNARLTTPDASVAAGEHVKVLSIYGMILEVTAVPLTQSA